MKTESNKFDISIEYCVPCDFSDYALKETKTLIKNFQNDMNRLMLITGNKGIFDVRVNGELIFSKKVKKRYPQPGEIVALIKEKMNI